MMKALICLLFLWLGLGQAVAQTRDAEPLELRYLYFNLLSAGPDYFSQMINAPEWFLTQKEVWKRELSKDKRSERAWENYMFACRMVHVAEKDSLQKRKLAKELQQLLKEMKQCIPHTRFYYQYLQSQTTDRRERDAFQRQISSLKRINERDYIADMDYYSVNNQMDKVEELAKEWYESGLFSPNLLYYCYNELVGLKDNAVLVCEMNLGTYYQHLLQYGMGLFKEVEIVTPAHWESAMNSEAWKERPVYFSQLIGDKSLLDGLKANMYSEGLVLRYSLKPYNNIAVMRKNYEQSYLLDYVRHPLLKYSSFLSDGVLFQTNYVVGFASLLQFYKTSGDKNQYLRLKRFLQGILDHFGNDGHLLNIEMIEGRKLAEAIHACIMEAKNAGRSYVVTSNLKEQLQKLIDPEQP